MAPQVLGRKLNRHEPVMFPRPTQSFQLALSRTIKAGRSVLEIRCARSRLYPPSASQIQTQFQTFRMKTARPLEGLSIFEIMPLDTDASVVKAAVQMPPTVGNHSPNRRFPGNRARQLTQGVGSNTLMRRLHLSIIHH